MEKSELLKQLRIERNAPAAQGEGRSWYVWGLLLAVSLGALGWWASDRAAPTHVETASSVAASAAQPSILDATGYVVARRQATVSAKITGKIEQVMIEEGQRVKEGETLALLDQIDARAQLELSQSQLAAARSQLHDLQIQLAQAQRDWQRQQDLVARRLTSVQASEQAATSVESFKARLVTQQRQVSVAEQSVRVAQVNLDNTVIRAPFSGVVVAKTAQPGEIVSPMSAGGGYTRTGIGTIVDMDSLEIEVDVNESFIGRVQAGQPVEARLNAYPDWAIPSEVIAIIPTADRTKATVKVRVAIKQKDPRIVPEMGVRVAFLDEAEKAGGEDRAPSGVLVPAAAVRSDADQSVIFVVVKDRVERRVVQTGETSGANRRILAGLRSGERVVLSPSEALKDGDKVSEE
ncbi:MAG: HlyD family secretion protein [Proteobacteria bacterium]|nr:HlyD family secretion protein [Pseudomonadota bacterium]